MEVPATQTVRTLRPLFFKPIQLETGTYFRSLDSLALMRLKCYEYDFSILNREAEKEVFFV